MDRLFVLIRRDSLRIHDDTKARIFGRAAGGCVGCEVELVQSTHHRVRTGNERAGVLTVVDVDEDKVTRARAVL